MLSNFVLTFNIQFWGLEGEGYYSGLFLSQLARDTSFSEAFHSQFIPGKASYLLVFQTAGHRSKIFAF